MDFKLFCTKRKFSLYFISPNLFPPNFQNIYLNSSWLSDFVYTHIFLLFGNRNSSKRNMCQEIKSLSHWASMSRPPHLCNLKQHPKDHPLLLVAREWVWRESLPVHQKLSWELIPLRAVNRFQLPCQLWSVFSVGELKAAASLPGTVSGPIPTPVPISATMTCSRCFKLVLNE